MKKLIIVLAAVVMGSVVQAASVDWAYTVTGADANDTTLYSGYSAYLFDKTTWEAVDFSTMAMADILADSLDSSDFGSKTTGMGSNKKRTWGSKDDVGTVGATRGATVNDKTAGGDTFDGYIVIFNADKTEYITESVSMTTRGTTDSGTDASTAKPAITSTSFAAQTWESTAGTTDVPEPTSGLLLALGGAMLALRRKRG